VFAVMEQDPGFAKLYFLLQQELLDPKYQVKGFTLPEVLTPTQDSQLRATQDTAVRAAWAPLPPDAMTINVNSRTIKVQAAQQGRQVGLNHISNWILVALMLVPVGLWITTIVGLRATGILKKALGRWALTALVLVFVAPFTCAGFVAFLAFLSNLAYSSMSYRTGQLLIALIVVGFLLGWLAAIIALAVYAWLRRDERARIVWLLLAAWVALGVVLAMLGSLNANPSGWLGLLAIVAYLAGLLALLLFGVGLYIERRRWPSVFVFAIVLTFIPAMIAAAVLPEIVQTVRLVETLGNPVVYMGPAGWLAGCAAGPGGAPNADGLSQLLPFGRGAMMSAPLPAPTAAPGAAKVEQETQPAGQAPRVRQFFPETLLWLPEIETDANGFVALDVPLADSITTWRVTALASTQDGKLGFSNAALRVFQDFFVDIDLPVALTQNDEVAIPVAVYNYLPSAQNVRLQVKPEDWFELQDQSEKTLSIAANDIDVVYFRIKVKQFGDQTFQVTALGDAQASLGTTSDAIKRTVAVVPDGRLFRKSKSDWLRESSLVTATLPIESIGGTTRIEVKIYPGVVSQVVEGLEKILRLPHG
jgi:MFS family permease